MSAHDPKALAHDSHPPGSAHRPTMINFDSSGVSMPWKTAGAVLVAGATVMLWWGKYDAGTVKAADLDAHDASELAHADHPRHADRIHKAEVVEMIAPLREKVEATEKVVITVQNGFFEQRAEDLAYRAVDAMPAKSAPRARIRRFDTVRKRALSNQKATRDIRDGIDVDLL